MQADALWQRMQAQEDAIEQAKREGRPAPEFASIFLPATATASSQQGSSGPQGSGQLSSQQATPQQSTDEQLFASPQFRAGLEARLKGLSDSTEAAAEEAAFRAEWIARAEAAEGVRRFRQARDERERQEREQRRAAGGDGVGGSWWDGIARRVWGER